MKYGLPDDETMRDSEEKKNKTAMEPESFVELNEAKRCVQFDLPVEGKKVHLEVPLKAVGNQKMVAARVAAMCFGKVLQGMSKQGAEKFRDEILAGYRAGEDVKDDSPAWAECKITLSHGNPLCSMNMEDKRGNLFHFQTTKEAAGSALECERIARLCYTKLKKGMSKEDALTYRNSLYKKRAADEDAGEERPGKRLRS
jgi:hypothetical protein